MTMTVHNYRPRQLHRTLNGEKSIKRLQRYGFLKFGSRPPARPDHDDNTPPARRAEGQKAKTFFQTMNSEKTPHTSPFQMSYGASFLIFWRKNTARYRECTVLKQAPSSWHTACRCQYGAYHQSWCWGNLLGCLDWVRWPVGRLVTPALEHKHGRPGYNTHHAHHYTLTVTTSVLWPLLCCDHPIPVTTPKQNVLITLTTCADHSHITANYNELNVLITPTTCWSLRQHVQITLVSCLSLPDHS